MRFSTSSPPSELSAAQQQRADTQAADLDEIPETWLAVMANFAMGHHNQSIDYSAPILKPVVSNIYPIFVLQYGLLILVGVTANVLVMYHILRMKLYKDVTNAFMMNLALSHLVQCLVVMPSTVMVLLLDNWIFGQFFCYFLPMLQDMPFHVVMITHLLIAWDRLCWLQTPMKCRLPGFVCSCATWIAGIIITLPYPIYIIYMDLGMYMKQFQGVGFCTVNLVDDMHEYMRGLFITMYCAPAVILSYLYIRTSRELRPPDGPLDVMMYEARADARNRQRPYSREDGGGVTRTRPYDLYDAEIDVIREKKTQRYLCSMAAVQIICISPLMVLRLARLFLEETYENTDHFDLTFLMFVWVAFLPTVINPWIYATLMLSRPAKERIRGYFRLSTKRTSSGSNKSPPGTSVTECEVESAEGRKGPQTKRVSESSALTASTVTRIRDSPRPEPARNKMLLFGNNIVGDEEAGAIARTRESPTRWSERDSMQSSFSNVTEAVSSTLERDLEIMDLLERERSLDIQQGLDRERRGAGSSRGRTQTIVRC